MKKHKWELSDDLLTLIIYLFDKEKERFNLAKAAISIGTTEDSLKLRIRNFIAIATKNAKGAKNYAKQSEKVFNLFAKKDEPAIAKEITKKSVLKFYSENK